MLYVLDQIDVLLGAWPVFGLVLDVKVAWIVWSVIIVIVMHQVLTTVTHALGMRASAR